MTIETTIGNMNASLWKYARDTRKVLEPYRVIVANRLARYFSAMIIDKNVKSILFNLKEIVKKLNL